MSPPQTKGTTGVRCLVDWVAVSDPGGWIQFNLINHRRDQGS